MNTCFTIEYKNVHYILKHNHLLDAKETMCLLFYILLIPAIMFIIFVFQV